MIVDNKKSVVRDRKLQYLLPIGLLVVICTFMFSDFLSSYEYKTLRIVAITTSILFYLGLVIYFYVKNYNYVFFDIDMKDKKLIFRYYSLKPFSFNPQNRMIEIPLDTFKKYEIVRSKIGINENLFLYQKIGSKIAKYPPISLTALNKDEKNALTSALNAIK